MDHGFNSYLDGFEERKHVNKVIVWNYKTKKLVGGCTAWEDLVSDSGGKSFVACYYSTMPSTNHDKESVIEK